MVRQLHTGLWHHHGETREARQSSRSTTALWQSISSARKLRLFSLRATGPMTRCHGPHSAWIIVRTKRLKEITRSSACSSNPSPGMWVKLEERALIKQNLALSMFVTPWSSSTEATRLLMRCLEVRPGAHLDLPLIVFAQLRGALRPECLVAK